MPELNTVETPAAAPARRVAQFRALAVASKLPEALADALAARPEMSSEKIEAVAAEIRAVVEIGRRAEIDDDELAGVVADALSEASPTRFKAAAMEKITAAWTKKGDQDLPMHGSSNAEHFASPHPVAKIGASFDGGSGFRAKMIAGLTARMEGRTDDPMARDAARLSIPDIAMQCCQLSGLRPLNGAEAVRMAAHSTSDFPLILENSLSNQVARALGQRQPDIVRAAHEIRREDYRTGKSLTLSATGMPQEVGEGGEVKFVTAQENGELLPTLRDFASGFNLTNKALANDATAIGVLNDMSKKMVQGAVERWRRILVEPIEVGGDGHDMADGQPVFDASHGNLAAEGGVLDVDTLGAARLAMRKQLGLNGELLAIEPWALVVPAELETTAQRILAKIEATKTSDVNPFSGKLDLIVEPALADGEAWYLAADPSRFDGLAYAFLDGQTAPRVESRPGWSTLGLELRLVWALDARFVEFRTWYKNPGASGGEG